MCVNERKMRLNERKSTDIVFLLLHLLEMLLTYLLMTQSFRFQYILAKSKICIIFMTHSLCTLHHLLPPVLDAKGLLSASTHVVKVGICDVSLLTWECFQDTKLNTWQTDSQ